MRARIVHLGTPRRIVATECCVGGLIALILLVGLGPTPVGLALLAACAATMVPVLLALGRLEKRGSRD
jgi:hypothetical protein